MHVLTLESRLLGNREVREEFDEDVHYVGFVGNHLLPFSCVVVGCHGGSM